MSLVSTQPSSVAHVFPWEVLGAVCEQADASTLVQLCLVSFGMLKLAGTVLYEHVELDTEQQISLFFIEPSLIRPDSRLRSSVGPHVLRYLYTDYTSFTAERVEAFLPQSARERPDRRVSSPQLVEFWSIRLKPSAPPYVIHVLDGIRKVVQPEHVDLVCSESHAPSPEETVDVHLEFPPRRHSLHTTVTHLLGIKLGGAATYLRILCTDHDVLALQGTLDLRRLCPFTLNSVTLRSVIRSYLVENNFWGAASDGDRRLTFLVASAEVEKLVKDTIAASPASEDRKNRCIVVRA